MVNFDMTKSEPGGGHRCRSVREPRGGFTLVELLISMTIGLVVVAASLSFAISTFKGVEGNKLREEVYRSSRFIGMSLRRDIQTAGVGIQSAIGFGTLLSFGDTLVVLAAEWDPRMAPAYAINPPFGSGNPLAPGGTCGALCIDLEKDSDGNFDLAPGDLARLQVNQERRLLIISSVEDLGGNYFRASFLADTTILRNAAAFQGGLLLDRYQTTVQKLRPVIYFAQDSILYRSQGYDSTGVLQASPMAYGVVDWDTWLVFTDNDVLVEADPTDGDSSNDYDDLLGARIAATLSANRADIRVNDGALFTMDFEWRVMPRNLMYERNR
jgi:prepilin-type N-terminal cleavage/methylation domain-containing protein